jgi:peroxin-16
MAAALKQQYEHLLLNNISAVASIEGGIRNVTWLLPGRFQDAEVASEGCELLYILLPSNDY